MRDPGEQPARIPRCIARSAEAPARSKTSSSYWASSTPDANNWKDAPARSGALRCASHATQEACETASMRHSEHATQDNARTFSEQYQKKKRSHELKMKRSASIRIRLFRETNCLSEMTLNGKPKDKSATGWREVRLPSRPCRRKATSRLLRDSSASDEGELEEF